MAYSHPVSKVPAIFSPSVANAQLLSSRPFLCSDRVMLGCISFFPVPKWQKISDPALRSTLLKLQSMHRPFNNCKSLVFKMKRT